MKKSLNTLFIGELLVLIASALTIFGIGISGLLSLVGLIFYLVGLHRCKQHSVHFTKAVRCFVAAVIITVFGVIATLVLGAMAALAEEEGAESLAAVLGFLTIALAIVTIIGSILSFVGNLHVFDGVKEMVPAVSSLAHTAKLIFILAALFGIFGSGIASIVGLPTLATVGSALSLVGDILLVVLLGKASSLAND